MKRILVIFSIFILTCLTSCQEFIDFFKNSNINDDYSAEDSLFGIEKFNNNSYLNRPNLKYSIITNIPTSSSEYNLKEVGNSYARNLSSTSYYYISKINRESSINELESNNYLEENLNKEIHDSYFDLNKITNKCGTILADNLNLEGLNGRNQARAISQTIFGSRHRLNEVNDTFENAYLGHIVEETYNTVEDLICFYKTDKVRAYIVQKEYTELNKALIRENAEILINLFMAKYDDMVATFAKESDLDNNGTINFIFHPYFPDNVLGYFYSGDLLTQANHNKSNEGEFLYLPTSVLTLEAGDEVNFNLKIRSYVATMIHEFQHLLFATYRYEHVFGPVSLSGYNTWITEGLSMCAEALMGYGGYGDLSGYVLSFLLNSENYSLLGDWGTGSAEMYGHSFLFLRYLMAVYGESNIISGLYNFSYKVSLNNEIYDEIKLLEAKTGKSFPVLYKDFVKMIISTGTGITNDPRYEVKVFNQDIVDESNTGGINLNFIREVAIQFQNIDNKQYNTHASTLLNRPVVLIEPYTFTFTGWKGNEMKYGNKTIPSFDISKNSILNFFGASSNISLYSYSLH